MKVFVYGTLMDGEPNNVFLQKDAVFLGRGETKPIYTLYDLWAFPAIAFGGDTSIKGEVYEVSDEVLRRLDQLEGYEPKSPGKGFYNRDLISVTLGEQNKSIMALTYFLDKKTILRMKQAKIRRLRAAKQEVTLPIIPTIQSGDWRDVYEDEETEEIYADEETEEINNLSERRAKRRRRISR